MSGEIKRCVSGLVLGAALSLSMVGCIVRQIAGPRLTGTCEGACAHYVACKPGHADADRARCLAECPDALTDRDALMTYESLSCDSALVFIDGNPSRTAQPAEGAPAPAAASRR